MPKHPLQAEWTEESKGSMRAKAQAGFLPGCAPVGYVNVKLQGEKAIALDPRMASPVRALFGAVAGGVSVREAGRIAASLGLRSRNGKAMGPSSLYAVLTNPFYMGMIRWNGKLIQGKHEPLIAPKLFESVQKKLGGKAIQHATHGGLESPNLKVRR